MTDPKSRDLYYAAGFFDGEGAIMLSRRRGYVRLEVAASQNTNLVLVFFVKWFGGHVYSHVPKGRSDTTIFQWKVYGDEAVGFLRLVENILVVKKSDAQECIHGWIHRHEPEIVDPIIQGRKERQDERRRRIAEAKASGI